MKISASEQVKLRISEPAKQDLLEIYEHIAAENQEAAERLLRKFQEKFEILVKFPKIGKEHHQIYIGARSFPVGKYVIIYESADEILEIVRVRHGATDIEHLFDI